MKNLKVINDKTLKFDFKELLAHPPLSGKSLTGYGSWDFGCAFFEREKGQRGTVTVIPNWFRNLFTDGTHKHEMLKQLCIQAHSSSLRCSGSLCKVQHDELYNASHCKSKFAFTLAEVLITLVIIGVVAALTIPNLMQKYTEQTTVKKVQKFYSTTSNAYSLARKENGPASEWGLTGGMDAESAEKVFEILFKPYFKIAKNCGLTASGNCIGKTYKRLDNISLGNYGSSNRMYKITLDDGSAVFIYTDGSDKIIVNIAYDVNGAKGPNQWGRDSFRFQLYLPDDWFGPTGIGYSGRKTFTTDCQTTGQGVNCAGWVIYKGNMDYLHCDDLSWTGKDKCSK